MRLEKIIVSKELVMTCWYAERHSGSTWRAITRAGRCCSLAASGARRPTCTKRGLRGTRVGIAGIDGEELSDKSAIQLNKLLSGTENSTVFALPRVTEGASVPV